MAEARSRGIAVVATSATVKGKQYWRLQVPGFKSMTAAKKAADPVKEQMKIKEVWIFKRSPGFLTVPATLWILAKMWNVNLMRTLEPAEFEWKSIFLCSCDP